MKQATIPLLFLTAFIAVTQDGFAQRLPAQRPPDVHRAGKWSAWIEGKRVGDPLSRAPHVHKTVYRQGPDDPDPVKLFEHTGTGGMSIRLREDGILFLQSVGGPSRLFFPGDKAAVGLRLPPPTKWKNRYFDPDPGIASNSGFAAFLEDVLFYGRSPGESTYLIGFVRIDAKTKRLTENRLCVEVTPHHRTSTNNWAAGIDPDFPPVRVGRYIFWKNRGTDNIYAPNKVSATWKPQKTRVLDLQTGALLPLDKVPETLLRENRTALLRFLQP